MNNGTGDFFNISVLDCKEQSHWQFEWGEGSVRFELEPEGEGCILLLKEYIPVLNDHTPKDLAGWEVCLEMFYEVLNGKNTAFPKESWKAHYEAYQKHVQPFLEEEK